jgi:hypothetical protein
VMLGGMLVVSFQVTCAQALTITPAFDLRDAQGTLIDSSLLLAARHGGQAPGVPMLTLPDQPAGELRYFVAGSDSRVLLPGAYELSVWENRVSRACQRCTQAGIS